MGTRNRFALVGFFLASALVSFLLTTRCVALAPKLLEHEAIASRAITNWVGAGVMAIGAVAAAWWALCFALAFCALAARTGSRVKHGFSALFERFSPRLLKIVVATVTGATVSISALPAGAATINDPGTTHSASAYSATTYSGPTLHLGFTDGAVTSTEASVSTAANASTEANVTTENQAVSSPSLQLGFLAPTGQPESTAQIDPAAQPEPTAQPENVSVTGHVNTTSEIAANTSASTTVDITNDTAVDITNDTAAGTTSDAATYTVAPGDSLWSIAQAQLPDGASNAKIADAWHALYEANKNVIGNNPDFLSVGLVLSLK